MGKAYRRDREVKSEKNKGTRGRILTQDRLVGMGGNLILILFLLIIVIIRIILFLIFIIVIPVGYILLCSIMDPAVRSSVGVSLDVKDWTLEGYRRVFQDDNIWRGFRNSIFYSVAFTAISVIVTLFAAYPMSRDDFMGRKLFNAVFDVFYESAFQSRSLQILNADKS